MRHGKKKQTRARLVYDMGRKRKRERKTKGEETSDLLCRKERARKKGRGKLRAGRYLKICSIISNMPAAVTRNRSELGCTMLVKENLEIRE